MRGEDAGPFIPVTLIVLFSAGGGFLVGYNMRPAETPVPQNSACITIVRNYETLNRTLDELKATRCMNVTTPVLNVSVYSTENLGVHKPAYDKPLTKGAANVPQVPGEDARPAVLNRPCEPGRCEDDGQDSAGGRAENPPLHPDVQ